MTTRNIYDVLLFSQLAGAAVAVGIAWRWPLLGGGFFARIENRLVRIAKRRGASVLVVGLLAIIVRLAVMPLTGVPVPENHDEFSYLLAADTFAHGRLTNPPHPMAPYLQSFHEMQSPTYMSKYPPAQGAVLALGQKIGRPWIGVLLSIAAMCAAIAWMLQGWLPSSWALLGGILAAVEFGGVNYWVSSYYGGAVSAIGGALMLGAIPRILLHRRVRDTLLFAVGIGLLVNSRPFEGLVFSAVVISVPAFYLLKRRKPSGLHLFAKIAAPVALVLLVVGAFMAYDNWRVTGDALVLPYQVYTRAYDNHPIFQWGTPEPPKQYDNPQFAIFYTKDREGWLAGRQLNWQGAKLLFFKKLLPLQRFYVPPEFAIPILAAVFFITKSRKVRFWFAICGVLTVAVVAAAWVNPHYVAAFTAAVYALIVFGLKRIYSWQSHERAVGVAVARALVLFHVLLLPAQAGALAVIHITGHGDAGWARQRAAIQSELESTPGRHMVLVRYPTVFNPDRELVYNMADIDNSKVVWAREIPGRDMQPLLRYFADRRLWIVEVGPNLNLYACDPPTFGTREVANKPQPTPPSPCLAYRSVL